MSWLRGLAIVRQQVIQARVIGQTSFTLSDYV